MAENKINFTKATIYGLPTPSKGAVTYRDSKEKGLSLYITKNRVITFFVRKRKRRIDKRFIIGNFPEVTVETARKTTVKIRGEIGQGVNPNEKKEEFSNELTFKELFEVYLNQHAKKHKRSYREDIKQYKRYLSKYKKYKISEISKKEMRELHGFIATNHGIYASNRLLSLLQVIFNKAVEWGIIKDLNKNPTTGIKKFKEKSRDRFLEVDELPRFFEALSKEENSTIRDYIFLS